MQEQQSKKRGENMKNIEEFPFEISRRVTKKETNTARRAIESKTGKKRKVRERPIKLKKDRYTPIFNKLKMLFR